MSEFKCSATFKRAEQLKRWEESETNQRSPEPKGSSRIRFSVDCVFLAACAAGDKDEVLRLVQSGADVNTPSADGLTALHQACIDDKLDMVEYLIKLGADVNHSDNEGWTPLHATASCGFVSIARFLLSHGANLSAVNNEGELPVDIAEAGLMKNFLHDEIQKQGIDCEKARSEEERLLTELSKRWYITKSPDAEEPDEKTGATPLHIAAAKGYIKVMNNLLGSCGVDVDPVDFDGWTPLHASAHWGQQEAASILVQYGADMDIKNYVGQTCFDVAISSMIDHLEDLKNRHDTIAIALYNKKRRPTGPDDVQIKHKKLDLQIENKTENNIIKKTVEKKNAVNTNSHSAPPSDGKPPKVGGAVPPLSGPLSPSETPATDDEPSWRHSSRQKLSHPTSVATINDKDSLPTSPSPDSEIILRRTQSCELDKLPQQDKQKKESVLSSNPSPARSSMENVNEQNEIASKSLPAEPTPSKISPGNIFKNFFKSFVPPVRDEESETQRKAHAKRVRETRRSTQGVTLDEIKSAEQLVKKKNNLIISKPESDAGSKRDSTISTDSESNQKETVTLDESRGEKGADSIDPVETETTVTIALPRASQLPNKKDEEKDADARGATQAAQNVIQRRRRPKRRSTGVVNVDLDEITPDQGSNDGTESGSESTEQSVFERSTQNNDEPTNIDYKALWEASQIEIKQLKEIILANERELEEARHSIEKYTNVITSVSENEKREKRERRATERKMSEMEEELKQLQKLKAENERLKAENRALTRVFQHCIQNENKRLKNENGALIRVISKLSK